MATQPAELVLAVGPDQSGPSRVRQEQMEAPQIHALTGDDHVGPGPSVDLGLGARRGLDAPAGALARRRIVRGYIALERTQAASIIVLGHQPVMQLGQVDRRPSPLPVLKPEVDRVSQRCGLMLLPAAAIDGASLQPTQVIANVAFGHVQLAGDGPLGNALMGQGLDGNTHLQVSGHRYAAPCSEQDSSVDNHPGGA